MARCAPYTEAARQRVRVKCVRSQPTFASMMNTDRESYVEIDVDAESVVVDESADFVVEDAVQPGARLRTRSRLEPGKTMMLEKGNQGGEP